MEIIIGGLLVVTGLLCLLGWALNREQWRQLRASQQVIAEVNVAFNDVQRRLGVLEHTARRPAATNVLPFIPKAPKGPPPGPGGKS